MLPFATIDIASVVNWLLAIPFTEWPQQHKLAGQLRPAMITDKQWHEFSKQTDAVVADIMQHFPQQQETWRALSVVMPGHAIPTHRDEQPIRVHIPITTNPDAFFIMNDRVFHLELGMAYQIDTREMHSIINGGISPRIHLMVDVCS